MSLAVIVYLGLSIISSASAISYGSDYRNRGAGMPYRFVYPEEEMFKAEQEGGFQKCNAVIEDPRSSQAKAARLMRSVVDELNALASLPTAKNYFDSLTQQMESIDPSRTVAINQILKMRFNFQITNEVLGKIVVGYANADVSLLADPELVKVSQRVSPELYLAALEYVLNNESPK